MTLLEAVSTYAFGEVARKPLRPLGASTCFVSQTTANAGDPKELDAATATKVLKN
jgi:hypothetical protein